MASSPSFAAPEGWAITQLAIHEERVDETGGVPFTGTVVVQLRLDAPRGDLAGVMTADRASFANAFDDFEVVDESSLELGPASYPRLEFKLTQQGHELQQMTVYFVHNEDVYMMTATHRAGDAFERVRKTAEGLLGSILG
jgi:hypothetical protein